jgi:Leucine Rich repeats (2 copies)
MSNNAQENINQLTNKAKIRYLDISNRDLSGQADLSEFTALTSLNSYNNKFESLDFLNSLPNKENLKKINFFGNQIKEIDLAWILTNFPNLEYLDCENNPLSAKNLENLTSEQFGKLVQGIKDKKIRINSWKGTILMDLLDYAQKLIKSGDSSQQQQAHQLQAILQNNSTKTNQGENNSKHTALIIGGAVAVIISSVLVGYLWGKKRTKTFS